MFLTKEQIKNKVAEIVYDNVNNDIVFIVAHRGIGKTKILQELYTLISSNNQLIAADGNAIYKNVSRLKKCYIDGIVQYNITLYISIPPLLSGIILLLFFRLLMKE